MIAGFGSDLVDIRRIERMLATFGERFERRVFTPAERRQAATRPARIAAHYAKRFAAKEAFLKALGSGLAGGISWQEIEVTNNASGAPTLGISGEARNKLDRLAPNASLWLTLSDEYPLALAQVIIER